MVWKTIGMIAIALLMLSAGFTSGFYVHGKYVCEEQQIIIEKAKAKGGGILNFEIKQLQKAAADCDCNTPKRGVKNWFKRKNKKNDGTIG